MSAKVELVPLAPLPPFQAYALRVPTSSVEVEAKLHRAPEQLLVNLATGGVLATAVAAWAEKGPLPAPLSAWTS